MRSAPHLTPAHLTPDSAAIQLQQLEDLWNTRAPAQVLSQYTPDTVWRDRTLVLRGRDAAHQQLTHQWQTQLNYRTLMELWLVHANRMAVRVVAEWHDDSHTWFRSYGLEDWELNDQGLIKRRWASANDQPLADTERLFYWPLGPRPPDYPTLHELNL